MALTPGMIPFIRRFASFVAAFALIQATAAPGMGGCTREHGVTASAAPSDHSTHHGDADCSGSQDPKQQEHGSDCLAACISMLGCSAPSFVAEALPSIATGGSSPIPSLVTPLHSGRSLAPDRPPPRA